MKGTFIAIVCLLFLGNCKTSTERSDFFKSGEIGAKSICRVLSLTHIVHHFILPYDSKFLLNHTEIKLIDSSLSDGDGMLYRINFGKGTTCRDGMTRKGACTIEISDSAKSYAAVGQWQAIAADSFAILTSKGWENIYGYFRVKGVNQDTARLFGNLHFLNSTAYANIKIDSTCMFNYYREGAFNEFKTGIIFKGFYTFITLGQIYDFQTENLNKKSDCTANWNVGNAVIKNENGDIWNINYNPFGNEACDQEFKVSRKNKSQLLEEVFSAW